jgi:hypothetical protein
MSGCLQLLEKALARLREGCLDKGGCAFSRGSDWNRRHGNCCSRLAHPGSPRARGRTGRGFRHRASGFLGHFFLKNVSFCCAGARARIQQNSITTPPAWLALCFFRQRPEFFLKFQLCCAFSVFLRLYRCLPCIILLLVTQCDHS